MRLARALLDSEARGAVDHVRVVGTAAVRAFHAGYVEGDAWKEPFTEALWPKIQAWLVTPSLNRALRAGRRDDSDSGGFVQ